MKTPHVRLAQGRAPSRGQALVEFSLVIIPFFFLIMGIFDLGRGIYMMNGTAEAAREIARVTSVHSGCPINAVTCDLGSSTQTANVVNTQKGLVPGLTINTATDITCVDINDTVKADNTCRWGVDYVRVRVTSSFSPITPIVSMFGDHVFESYSRVRYYP
jgi:Flp pilus assembly protein TadG